MYIYVMTLKGVPNELILSCELQHISRAQEEANFIRALNRSAACVHLWSKKT